jgi:formate dehydrogenase major subunit
MSEVHLKINGQDVVAQSGQTILEAARAAGVEIPTLCYHPALSAWGACRMCLVEVKGMRGLQTACTCPATEGMEVEVNTPQTIGVRTFVLQLLFSERNHYCMYCQMSGNCELQDMAYKHGLDHWTYPRPFQKLEVDASRKYFISEPNRCILCTRCVRACSEVAANHTLNVRARGYRSMIIADLDVPFGQSTCVECGSCLQVCPTGALIDARSAYGGREKDVTHTETTCMQCSVGCKLDVVTRYSRLLRVDGVWDSDPNGGLLCVDGRFAPLYDTRKRVTKPLVRKDGKLVEAGWDEALALIVAQLKAAGNAVQGLAATATTNEALAAFAAFAAKAGCKAGRLEPVAPTLGYGEPAALKDLLESDFIVVAGADPLTYQKVVGYFIKRAVDQGTQLAVISDSETGLNERATLSVKYAQAGIAAEVAAKAERPVVVYSVGLPAEVIAALKPLADKARFLALDPARNGKGAEAAGLAPLAPDHAKFIYLLLGEQVEDEALSGKLDGAFTVVHASYVSPLVERADVVLPAPLWYERAGHVTNLEGKVLPLQPALPAPAGVRDDAEVLTALVALL